MKKILYLILAIFLAFLSKPGAGASFEAGNDAIVRVCITDDKDSVRLNLKSSYKIYAIDSNRVLMDGPYLSATVSAVKDGFQAGKRNIKVYGMKVKVARDSSIYVDGRRFRGDIDIIRKGNGLMVINHVGLEEYLYGVLYHEISHLWPMEVLKAQAIAARTFAIYQARQNKIQPFDLRNDVYSQMYGGRTSEKWSTTRAVNLTRGSILIYKGEILPAYYHATCAGYTEDASNLWNVNIEPLKGVPCTYCVDSPHYKWAKEIALRTIEDKLEDNGYKIDKINSVSILSKNRSGRADKIEIKDNAGVSIILTGKDFRQVIGPNEARSTRFDALIKGDDLLLNGFGWGHGVGMCQWGAYGQARRGKKAKEILTYYYPGAEITTIDNMASKI